MDREKAKALLPIIQAYSEGKTIQFLKPDSDEWRDVLRNENNEINFEDLARYEVCYRVKPEPKYRPFNEAEECWTEMLKHQPVGYIKDENDMYNIVKIRGNSIIIGYTYYNYIEALGFTFMDGTPFGIKE